MGYTETAKLERYYAQKPRLFQKINEKNVALKEFYAKNCSKNIKTKFKKIYKQKKTFLEVPLNYCIAILSYLKFIEKYNSI
jgi:hypothetical protein